MAQSIDEQIKIKKLVSGAQAPDITTGKGVNNKLANPNISFYNQDVSQLRQAGNELAAIRLLARANGDVSATVSAMVRIANSGLRFRVYDSAHQLSGDGSNVLRSLIKRMETQFDYTTGFDNRQSFNGVVESLIRSCILTGAVALELVLDKQRLPYALKIIPVEKIVWVVSSTADGVTQKLFPRINSQKGNIDLDIPTVVYAALDYDPMSAYCFSPIEPAINTSIFHAEMVQDIRRVTLKSGHSRLLVTLDYEELVKTAPIETRSDMEKLASWVESIRSSVQQEIEGLAPESAIITFSNVQAEYLNSQIGASGDYTGLVGIINALLATSLKTPQSILGKDSGGMNTSSVESLLFLKTASGLHQPVETAIARLLTLAVRLVGFEGYVEAEFNPIDLRPESELWAYRQMEAQFMYEALSYGFLSDDECAERLNLGARTPGAPKLSGTMFYGNKQGMENPNPNSDPARTALTGSQPKNSGGKDNKPRS